MPFDVLGKSRFYDEIDLRIKRIKDQTFCLNGTAFAISDGLCVLRVTYKNKRDNGGIAVEENITQDISEYGTIRISDEVVSIIAGLAATEIEGIAGMSGGVVNGITEMLGKKNLSKGVKVEVGEKEATIDLYTIVEYGVRIPDVAWKVQENVKKAVETMTGLKILAVNIHVQGVNIDKNIKQEDTGGKTSPTR